MDNELRVRCANDSYTSDPNVVELYLASYFHLIKNKKKHLASQMPIEQITEAAVSFHLLARAGF